MPDAGGSGIDVETLHGRRATDRWNRLSIGDIFERLTWSHPDRDAIVAWPGAYANERFATVTYRQADAEANRIAHALLASGLQRSDRVLLYCENSVEAVLLLVGAAKAGLVVAPINPLLAPDVVGSLIAHIEPSFAVVDAELWPRAAGFFAAAGLSANVTIGIGGPTIEGSVDFTAWMGEQPANEPEVEIAGDDVWSLLFTSGTTALPKASMGTHTYSHLVAYTHAMSLTRGLRFEDELRLMNFLPIIYHCGHNSCVFSAFLSGGTLILGRRPDPVATAAAITALRPTAIWAGSPMFLDGVARAATADPSAHDLTSLRVALFSWGAMPPPLAARLKELCGPDLGLVEVFGQTEAMSCFRFWSDQHPEKYLASAPAVNVVGVPNPLLGAAIMDPEGRLITEPGVPGEAVYRSPAVTAGYYRDAEATREVFRHGWFHSGDSTRYDADGLQVMVDRFKDIVKSGGENVSSIRVESVLAQHPAVGRAAVIGLADERWGEIVTGVVLLEAGAAATEADLIAFCRERLAGYESPKQIVFVGDMPQTVGGKILKYRLRAMLAPAAAR